MLEIDFLNNLKRELKNRLRKGTICPVCDQNCKEYKRKLRGEQCADLIRLYALTKQNPQVKYFHREKITKATSSGGDFAKLKFWGFINQAENEDTSKRTSGLWRLTGLGRDFVEGKIAAPTHVYIYNQKCNGHSVESGTIKDFLGDAFDYQELMAA